MGFRDRVGKDLRVAVKEGVDLLKEGTTILKTEVKRLAKQGTSSMEKEARRMTKISQLRYEHFRLNQKAQQKFTELGGHVYDVMTKNPAEFRLDSATQRLFQETKQVEDRLKKLKTELQKLSKGK